MKIIQKLSLFLLIFLSINLNAQDEKEDYALLWEISGNGLTKNSYLFGTMHVRDRRAFEFSDSVLIYLDRADVFASEIHPDSLISGRWSNVYFDENYLNVQEVLRDSSNLGIEVLKYERPLLLQALLTRSMPKDDDMPTFVDAYLFNLARSQNKPTYGLESIQEQFGISYEEEYLIEPNYSFNFLFYNKKGYDMIDLYQQGNINDINEMMTSTMTEGYRYILLTKRNQHMVDRMERHMRGGSAFVAVGTAHLPGDDGMIKMLRDKGYTVRKVSPHFDYHIAENYKARSSKQKWHTFTQAQHGYSIDMPARPHSSVEKKGFFKIHQYPDIGTNNVYSTFALNYSHLDTMISPKALERKVIISLLQSADSNKFEGKKNVELAGINGMEAKIKKSDGRYFRLRIYQQSKKTIVQMLTTTEDELYSESAERYFNSFKLLEEQPYQLIADTGVPLMSKQGAFSVIFPRNPMYVLTSEDIPQNEDEYTYKYHLFVNQNLPTRNQFSVRYNDSPLGYINRNDSILMDEGRMHRGWYGKDTTYAISMRDYSGKAFQYRKGRVKERIYVRGNRIYTLSASLYDKRDSVAMEQFFDSFTFTDYAPRTFESYTSSEDGFETSFPTTPNFTIDTLIDDYYGYDGIDYLKQYQSRNDHTGNAYYISINQLSDYYYSENQDSLFADILALYTDKKDSIIYNKPIQLQGLTGRDYLISQHQVNTNLRVRMFLKNREVYLLTAFISNESLNDKQSESFFDNFQWDTAPEESMDTDLFEPKSAKLLADIQSSDTIISKNAYRALAFYEFKEEHIPAILSSLHVSYPDDEVQYKSTRSRLIRLLRDIDSPELTAQLEEAFHAVKESRTLQIDVLEELTRLGNEKALNRFFDLAKTLSPQNGTQVYSRYLFRPFFDSLELAQARYPELLSLAKKGNFQSQIFRLTYSILDQDSVDVDFFAPYEEDYRALLSYNLNVYRNAVDSVKKEEALDLLPDLVQLLEKFDNGSGIVSIMEDMVEIDDPDLQEKALYILLTNEQKVSKSQLEELQAHLPQWYSLLKKLHKKRQLGLIPDKYLSQARIAEAAFHYYLENRRAELETVKYIKTEKVTHRGEEVNIYIYKFKKSADSDNWYLGICGPQPLDLSKYDFSNDFTSVDWQEFDESFMETQINRLVYRLRYKFD